MPEIPQNLEVTRNRIFSEWQKLSSAGISAEQVVGYLGRPDLLVAHHFTKTGTTIFRFDIERFIQESVGSRDLVSLPSPSVFLGSDVFSLPSTESQEVASDFLISDQNLKDEEEPPKILSEEIRENILLDKGIQDQEIQEPLSQKSAEVVYDTDIEGKYIITVLALSIVIEKSEKFVREVVRRRNIVLKKNLQLEGNSLYMTSEDAQQIMKDLDNKLIDDDWVFWENYPPEVERAMRGYIKKTKK